MYGAQDYKRPYDQFSGSYESPSSKRTREFPEDLALRFTCADAEALKRKVDELVGYGAGYGSPGAAQQLAYLHQTVGVIYGVLDKYAQGGSVAPITPPPLGIASTAPLGRADIPLQVPQQVNGKPETNIYVSGLPLDATDDFMIRLFSPFGPVKSVRLFDGMESRGRYGFCRMVNHMDALAAVQALHKTPFSQSPTGTLFVTFKRSSEKDVAKLTGATGDQHQHQHQQTQQGPV